MPPSAAAWLSMRAPIDGRLVQDKKPGWAVSCERPASNRPRGFTLPLAAISPSGRLAPTDQKDAPAWFEALTAINVVADGW